ncbi:E3 UFM1-protein ligase 1 [Mortierella sp. NVP85]|nr:E3 UFM1-protein ligase 1 [Mortierella sp. NVP85]
MASRSLWESFFGVRDSPEDIGGPASLSEDACGDLVHSLVHLGYLTNISHSLDGKSFITQEHLSQDILLQLGKRNGRVSVLDLPKAINANLSDIQDRVQELVRTGSGKLFLVQDDLIKVEYLNNMTEQLNEELSRQGYFVTTDLCRKYNFGIAFVQQFLRDRVGSVISGQWDAVDRGLVITPSFLEKEKAALLNALGELQEPTSLQTLRQKHVVQEQLFYGLCDTLSKEQGLPGVFKGTNDQGVFVPRPYEQQQTEWVESFFRNNGFIELDSIKKRGISDPRAYIQTNHPTALLLETHAVKDSIWSIVDASVEDTIANLSWIDVKPLLPSPLTKGDIAGLLRQLPSLTEPTTHIAVSSDQDQSLTGFRGGLPQEAVVIQDTIVATSGQFQKSLLMMGPLLDRSLKAVISWRLSFDPDGNYEGQDDDEDLYGFGDRGSSLKELIEYDSSTQIRQRKDNKRKGNQGASKPDGSKKKPIHEFLTMKDVREEVQRLEPDFDLALVNCIAKVLYGDLVRNLRDRNRSVVLHELQENDEEVEDKDKEPVEVQDTAVKSLGSAIYALSRRIELSARGIDVFEGGCDPAVKNSLSKYLLQSWCVELLGLAVLHLSSEGKAPSSASDSLSDATKTQERLEGLYAEHQRQSGSETEGGRGSFAISPEDTTILLELVPRTTIDPLKKMRKLIAGSGKHKNLSDYLDLWSSLYPTMGLEAVRVHAKDERSVSGRDVVGDLELCLQGALHVDHVLVSVDRSWLSDHLEELHRILVGIKPLTEPALMLHIVVLIAFQSWTGTMLHASGKFVPRILRQLRLSIGQQQSGAEKPEQASAILQLDLLEKMLDSVLANVKQQRSDDQAGDPGDPNELWKAVFNIGVLLSKPTTSTTKMAV